VAKGNGEEALTDGRDSESARKLLAGDEHGGVSGVGAASAKSQ
jgi:hypothetical protein